MAGIIKAGDVRERSVRFESTPFNFQDITETADRYLTQVRQQGDQIIADAQARAVELTRSAVDKMRESVAAEAEQDLQRRLSEQLDAVLPAINAAIQKLEQARESWIKHWEEETVALAIAIAERIVRRELQSQPEIRQELIRESLTLAVGIGECKLHLNPADYESLSAWLPRLRDEFGERLPTEIVADSSVSLGGCRVSSHFGVIDQTIETQLDRIQEELTLDGLEMPFLPGKVLPCGLAMGPAEKSVKIPLQKAAKHRTWAGGRAVFRKRMPTSFPGLRHIAQADPVRAGFAANFFKNGLPTGRCN